MGLIITVGLSFTPMGIVYAGMIGGAIGAAFNGGNIFVGACLGALGGGATIAGPFSQVLWSGMEAQMTGGSAGRSMLATAIGFGSDSTGGLVGAMILGGVSSEITGGKFENGAATAAFSYLMRMAAEKFKVGGKTLDEPHQKNIVGFGESGVGEDIDESYFEKNPNLKITKTVVDGVKHIYIEGKYTYENMAKEDADKIVLKIKNSLNVKIENAGVLHFNLIYSPDAEDAITIKMDGGACKSGYVCADLAGKNIYVTNQIVLNAALAVPASYPHEFGHLLGFKHANNGVLDIMSYDYWGKFQKRHFDVLDKNY